MYLCINRRVILRSWQNYILAWGKLAFVSMITSEGEETILVKSGRPLSRHWDHLHLFSAISDWGRWSSNEGLYSLRLQIFLQLFLYFALFELVHDTLAHFTDVVSWDQWNIILLVDVLAMTTDLVEEELGSFLVNLLKGPSFIVFMCLG